MTTTDNHISGKESTQLTDTLDAARFVIANNSEDINVFTHTANLASLDDFVKQVN